MTDAQRSYLETLCRETGKEFDGTLLLIQKKSRRAIATPKSELDLIATRLARAKEDYEAWQKSR